MRQRGLTILLCLLVAAVLCACGQKEQTTEVVIAPVTQTPEPQATPVPDLAGDWYGWWHIRHTTGDWKKMYGYFWDCCAKIGEDGSLLLWDESLPKDNALAETTIRSEGGVLRCSGGYMLDASGQPESWELAVTEDKGGTLLTISGRYEAVESEGGFSFEIFLRPWGDLWPGKDNEIPYYYEDWYLPLIRAGSAMPDTIGP